MALFLSYNPKKTSAVMSNKNVVTRENKRLKLNENLISSNNRIIEEQSHISLSPNERGESIKQCAHVIGQYLNIVKLIFMPNKFEKKNEN